MQISAINPNFTGNRDRIDAFINMDDQSLRQIAYAQTANPKEDKRSRRKSNLLMASMPIAAGIAAAAKTPKSLTKTGRLGKLAQFATTSTKWFAAFGIIAMVGAARNKIHEKSEKARELAQKHPVLSLANTIAVSMLAISGAYKGFGKLADKVLPKFIDKYDAKITNKIVNIGKKLDNNKFLNKVSEAFGKVSSKIPDNIKEFGKGVLDWSPTLLGLGAIVNTSRHTTNKVNAINDKYIELKDKQIALAQARNRELQIQKDFLLTDPQNAEDLKEVL